MERILATLDRLSRVEDIASVETVLREAALPLGYDRFVLFAASALRDDLVERIYWVEGDWFADGEAVDAETYVRRCPVTRHLLEAEESFFWTKTRAAGGERYRVVKRPYGRGIHGLQVPVFGHSGLEGAVSFGGEQVDSSLEARVCLTVLGQAGFLMARRIVDAPHDLEPARLSPRERDVLRWTAAGRRQADVAATLGLSERTVENHLRRARKRLGATTTAQAIRIAIRSGEIEE